MASRLDKQSHIIAGYLGRSRLSLDTDKSLNGWHQVVQVTANQKFPLPEVTQVGDCCCPLPCSVVLGIYPFRLMDFVALDFKNQVQVVDEADQKIRLITV